MSDPLPEPILLNLVLCLLEWCSPAMLNLAIELGRHISDFSRLYETAQVEEGKDRVGSCKNPTASQFTT